MSVPESGPEPQPEATTTERFTSVDLQRRDEVGQITADIMNLNLPHRRPKSRVHTRTSGQRRYTVTGGTLTGGDGTVTELSVPYGRYARIALLWMVTEARKTDSPELVLGSSMRNFVDALGIPWGGPTAAAVLEQLKALFSASIEVNEWSSETNSSSTYRCFLSSANQLFFSSRDKLSQDGILQSKVILSQEFFERIRQSTIPVSLGAYRKLLEITKSSMALDIYMWLSGRLYRISERAPVYITWEQLQDQFGTAGQPIHQFRETFRQALKDVLVVYPEARVTEDKIKGRRTTRVVLYRSPKAVRDNRPTRRALEAERPTVEMEAD